MERQSVRCEKGFYNPNLLELLRSPSCYWNLQSDVSGTNEIDNRGVFCTIDRDYFFFTYPTNYHTSFLLWIWNIVHKLHLNAVAELPTNVLHLSRFESGGCAASITWSRLVLLFCFASVSSLDVRSTPDQPVCLHAFWNVQRYTLYCNIVDV